MTGNPDDLILLHEIIEDGGDCMDRQVSSSNATKSVLVSSTVAVNWCKMTNAPFFAGSHYLCR